MGKYGRATQVTDYNTIRSMLFAYSITKATGTFSEYATLVLSDGKDG